MHKFENVLVLKINFKKSLKNSKNITVVLKANLI